MAPGQLRALTPTDVAQHLACRHRTQLDRLVRAGKLRIDFAPDARLEAMRVRGEQHERRYIETLRREGLRVVDLAGSDDPTETLTAMQQGAEVIVQAPLRNEVFRGRADLLRRVAAASALGSHAYEPVDTKLAAETKAGALLQLLTYCELLRSMQGCAPERFHVVTPLAPEAYRRTEYDAYFRLVQRNLQVDVAAEPPPATYPDPVPFCEVCSYWNCCEQRRRRDDHPSLIANIRSAQVREFQRQQLPTVTAIAQARGLPAEPRRGNAAAYVRLADQARLQVAARAGRGIPVETIPVERDRGLALLPEPTPGDVFLDFEGDPFVGEGGLEYLTGYAFRGDGGDDLACQSLWAFDRAAERNAAVTFLDFVAERQRAHPELHVFHFGGYEVAALRRLCSRHDTHGDVLDRLLRGRRFVDLFTVVRQGLRIGVERYGLKELEPLTGFRRALDARTTGIARRDLELHLELGRRERITPHLQATVQEYNRDDCFAAARLRDWLEQQRSERIRCGEAVPRPAPAPMNAPESVTDRERRIDELRAALERDLPPEQRNGEQRARALLAGLVGYFKREDKSGWWEHFRLRELPREQHLDDRGILAGLQFVQVLPRPKGRRTDRCEYRFPPQDADIRRGDTVCLTQWEDAAPGIGTRLGTVEAFDPDEGTITIAQGRNTADLRPTSVFREQVVPNAKLEQAVLAIGEHVCGHGFTAEGPFALACQLLLAARPRLRSGSAGALVRAGEGGVTATLRVCRDLDGAVLPIQGPPGSGKSYTGGQVIAALVRDGKKVGVTAVSHKVMDNLLQEVRKAAAEAGVAVRILHKDDVEEERAGITYTDDNANAMAAVGSGTVVAGTAWLWARDDAIGRLDYLFLDEAGQMSLAQALACTRATRNLVLLGDPQQLEQPQKGAHPDGVEIAVLTHMIGAGRATVAGDQGLFLHETWRLPPVLCTFTSDLYYESRLIARPECARQRLQGTRRFDGVGFFLVETAHEGNQAQSDEEVQVVRQLIAELLEAGGEWTDRKGETHPLTASQIMAIAPYNAQVAALHLELSRLGVDKVGTVDRFQGQQAPVVVYSCASSSPQDAPRGISFLCDPHRLNVATSRAQCIFVMVANAPLFTPDVRTPEQMRQVNGLCRFREVAKPIQVT